VLNIDEPAPSMETDPYCLSQLKHYRSLLPLLYEARKPVFALKPADGAFGGHQAAVQDAAADFAALAERILTEVGRPAAWRTQGAAI
jgi:chromosome partitioning protein